MRSRPGVVLAAMAIALAPVAVFASNGTVVVVVLGGLVLALSRPELRAALAGTTHPLALALILFIAWASISSLWAPDLGRSLTLSVRCGLLFAAGLICVTAASHLSAEERAVALRGIAFGGAAMLLLLAIEMASDAGLTRLFRGMDMATLMERTNNVPLARGGTLLAVFCWPALLVVARQFGPRCAVLLFLPVPAVLYLQPITASLVAIVLATAVFVLAYAWTRGMLVLTFGVFLLSLATAPLLPPLLAQPEVEEGARFLPLSWQHRVEIWKFAADRIAERPLLGWGFDATRILGRAAKSEVLPGNTLAMHPHNFSLQVWLELGAVGMAIVFAFGVLLFRWLWRRAGDRAATAAALAALTAYLVFGQISRGAWQNWWLAAAWLLAAVLAVALSARPGRGPLGAAVEAESA